MSVTWQRPQSRQYTKFCAVSRYEGGASIAACGGRWATASTYVLIGVDVGKLECPTCRDALVLADFQKLRVPACSSCGGMLLFSQHDAGSTVCGVCQRAAIGAEVEQATGARSIDPVSAALRELRSAPVIVTAELHTAPREGVLFEGFDTSDAERDA